MLWRMRARSASMLMVCVFSKRSFLATGGGCSASMRRLTLRRCVLRKARRRFLTSAPGPARICEGIDRPIRLRTRSTSWRNIYSSKRSHQNLLPLLASKQGGASTFTGHNISRASLEATASDWSAFFELPTPKRFGGRVNKGGYASRKSGRQACIWPARQAKKACLPAYHILSSCPAPIHSWSDVVQIGGSRHGGQEDGASADEAARRP
jgi:hypothetical protein